MSYQSHYANSHALLIGIDDYPLEFPPLATAVKGVRELADLLVTELDFAPRHVITLANDEATENGILQVMNDVFLQPGIVGEDDRVLIYFAGHGVTFDSAEGEIGAIVPYDGRPGNIFTTIEMDRLTQLANRMYAKHVLFLLDACFSGFATMRELPSGVQRQLHELTRRRARQVITAGTRDQLVSDGWGPGGHSLFTGFLLDGLRGAAPTPGGVLRTHHLAGYLQDHVSRHSKSRQTPQYAPLMGSQGGDFVFEVHEVSALPGTLEEAVNSANPATRLAAVGTLRDLARSADTATQSQVLAYLADLAQDPDSLVSGAAETVLREIMPHTEVAPVTRDYPVIADDDADAEYDSPNTEPILDAAQREPVVLDADDVTLVDPSSPSAPPDAVVSLPPQPAAVADETAESRSREGVRRRWWPIAVFGAILAIGLAVIVIVLLPNLQNGTLIGSGSGTLVLAEQGVDSNDEWTPFIRTFDGVQMTLVPAGCFLMGSSSGEEDEQPLHRVCFEQPFWFDVYEVSNQQFGDYGCQDVSGDPDQPRNCIGWQQAQSYCEARDARLPTESEWEYAARGPDEVIYPYGNDFRLSVGSSDTNDAAPVDSAPDYASWVGAFHMHDNVWEWTADWYDEYPSGLQTDPDGPRTGVLRVIRGGSWRVLSTQSYASRAAYREKANPNGLDELIGFRCARDY